MQFLSYVPSLHSVIKNYTKSKKQRPLNNWLYHGSPSRNLKAHDRTVCMYGAGGIKPICRQTFSTAGGALLF